MTIHWSFYFSLLLVDIYFLLKSPQVLLLPENRLQLDSLVGPMTDYMYRSLKRIDYFKSSFLVSDLRNLRPGKIKWFIQHHAASLWQNYNWNPCFFILDWKSFYSVAANKVLMKISSLRFIIGLRDSEGNKKWSFSCVLLSAFKCMGHNFYSKSTLCGSHGYTVIKFPKFCYGPSTTSIIMEPLAA